MATCSTSTRSASTELLVPAEFVVPQTLETALYRLEPLAESHTQLDYEAVMETQQRLRAGAPNGWPADGFTVAENRQDLIKHEREFAARSNFAFTVLSPERQEVLGCVYFNPAADGSPTADGSKTVDVHMWVREREYDRGLAQHLHRHVDSWLRNDWPFTAINYLRPDYYFAKGSCLCEAVVFYAGPITGPFELCHCSRCRRTSGSAFVAGVGVGEVRFVRGADQIRRCELPVIKEPPAYVRCFCESCGSVLPDPHITGAQEVPAGALEVLEFQPQRHIYVDGAPEWSLSDAPLPRFTEAQIREFRKADIGSQ